MIHEIAISPEGERLAVASAIGIWLYSIPELEDIAWFETEGPVTGIEVAGGTPCLEMMASRLYGMGQGK